MDEIAKIMIEDFEKKPDGSWVAVKNSDINTKSGKVIRIAPGMTFRKGTTLWGIDVVNALDKISAN
ncbi:MAG TPA: hypothetical protein PKM17_13990 [Syntrophorhabdus sp.]|nr:hypothetical protein [Syntrophorhabdus sp.]